MYSGKGSPPRWQIKMLIYKLSAGVLRLLSSSFFSVYFHFPGPSAFPSDTHTKIYYLTEYCIIYSDLRWAEQNRSSSPTHYLQFAHCMTLWKLTRNSREWVGSAKSSDFRSFAPSVLCADEHVGVIHILSSVHGQSPFAIVVLWSTMTKKSLSSHILTKLFATLEITTPYNTVGCQWAVYRIYEYENKTLKTVG